MCDAALASCHLQGLRTSWAAGRDGRGAVVKISKPASFLSVLFSAEHAALICPLLGSQFQGLRDHVFEACHLQHLPFMTPCSSLFTVVIVCVYVVSVLDREKELVGKLPTFTSRLQFSYQRWTSSDGRAVAVPR